MGLQFDKSVSVSDVTIVITGIVSLVLAYGNLRESDLELKAAIEMVQVDHTRIIEQAVRDIHATDSLLKRTTEKVIQGQNKDSLHDLHIAQVESSILEVSKSLKELRTEVQEDTEEIKDLIRYGNGL